MKKVDGDPGLDYDAHHVFPREFKDFFKSVGIDIDAPENGQWIDLHDHRSNSGSYNDLWRTQINYWENNGLPSQQEVFDFLNSLGRTY